MCVAAPSQGRSVERQVQDHALHVPSLDLSHFLLLFLDPTVLSLSEDGCLVAAMLIHYLVLSSVTWMLIEGLHLLMVVTCTFASQAHHLPTYWLVGYGSSAVVVATTALVAYGTSPDAWQSQTAYGDLHNGAFCWLSTENGFIWAFTGPLVFVIVFNTVSLIAILCSAAGLQANRQKSLPQKIK
ncbi:adhesion G protein-coupled receptor L4-like [Oratosquilla oratoria]|uniref:adhesion G protein-coupled receptor L4-like n=1 Tax=Oratosquilla oratoria TaxID=337810 RepID=UPI003F7643CC